MSAAGSHVQTKDRSLVRTGPGKKLFVIVIVIVIVIVTVLVIVIVIVFSNCNSNYKYNCNLTTKAVLESLPILTCKSRFNERDGLQIKSLAYRCF